ncbi:MAG TPA: hypothetical protein VEX68_08870 [Bryobacteraceae bacterium]|nr:hypothetical protein [Bryobacteraceae bacterium]
MGRQIVEDDVNLFWPIAMKNPMKSALVCLRLVLLSTFPVFTSNVTYRDNAPCGNIQNMAFGAPGEVAEPGYSLSSA